MAGGLAAWDGDLDQGVVELDKNRNELDPRFEAVPTLDELRGRLDDPELTILDVRRAGRVQRQGRLPVRPAPGAHPRREAPRGRRALRLAGHAASPRRRSARLVGLPEGAEIVAYCHSGSRSALAAMALRSAGYRARNYPGSWHEWSRRDDLPIER